MKRKVLIAILVSAIFILVGFNISKEFKTKETVINVSDKVTMSCKSNNGIISKGSLDVKIKSEEPFGSESLLMLVEKKGNGKWVREPSACFYTTLNDKKEINWSPELTESNTDYKISFNHVLNYKFDISVSDMKLKTLSSVKVHTEGI